MHNVVCISRHDGAGAHELALAAANDLGFRLIDEQIVTRAAVEAGVDRAAVTDAERGRSALVRLIEGFGVADMGAGYAAVSPTYCGQVTAASDDLRGLIRSVIEGTAAEGRVVIVAHAASLALARRADVLRVLVTASARARAQRLASMLAIDAKQAARAIKRSDAARADYIKRFYAIGTELPTHYDLVINTDRLAGTIATRLIVEAARGSGASGLAQRSSREESAAGGEIAAIA